MNGTVKLIKWAAERGETFDHCILGEPSNAAMIGDTIKIGRRGSLNGHLIVTGKSGHVAYPQRADNPVRGIVTLINALQSEPLDKGSATFQPSNLEFTTIDVGTVGVSVLLIKSCLTERETSPFGVTGQEQQETISSLGS